MFGGSIDFNNVNSSLLCLRFLYVASDAQVHACCQPAQVDALPAQDQVEASPCHGWFSTDPICVLVSEHGAEGSVVAFRRVVAM